MDKIKRLINCIIPVSMCNFKCHYCYVAQTDSFEGEIFELKYDLDHIQKALTVERLGGICMMNCCASGETLLAPYIVELVKRLLENGHYVTIVTNGSQSKKISDFCNFSKNQKERLFFKFSYQFLELKRLNLLKTFFNNIKNVQEAGISFSVELTANDEAIEYLDEIKQACIDGVGALPHIIESRDNNNAFIKLTKLDNKEHMKKWGKKEFDTPLIEFQDTLWGTKRKEFCYAGDWIGSLNLLSGDYYPCFAGGPVMQNLFENTDEPIHFCAIGNTCPWSHCYAAHVLLTLGAIPELKTPTYAEMRDRKTKDNKTWLNKNMKQFMSSKLIESNKEYSDNRKKVINWYRKILFDIPLGAYDSISEVLNLKLKNKKIAIFSNEKYNQPLLEEFIKAGIDIRY